MSTRERIDVILDELPPEKLEVVERLLRGLAPQDRFAALSPQERQARARPLVEKARSGDQLTRGERLELADLACGIAAHLPGSTEEFLREKHEETEREDVRCGLALARRLGGTFVSTDHKELDPLAGTLPITFIRTDTEFRAWLAAGRPPL